MKRFAANHGFTLIEMLTIIGIIVLLLSIAVPTISRMRTAAMRETTSATIATLSSACEAYKSDVKEYPPSSPWSDLKGRSRLAQCLIGYREDDGLPGTGFRIGRSSQYGPYVDLTKAPASGNPLVFYDTFGQEIYYYCFDRTAKTYNASDNSVGSSPKALPDIPNYAKRPDGTFVRETFLILSAGPDGGWSSPLTDPQSDDVASFDQ